MVEIDAVVAAGSFAPALDGLRRLGLVVRMIMPADDPAIALVEGDGMTIRLVGGDMRWPNGLSVPPLMPVWEVSRAADTGADVGRAGMLYRDILPSRQGGRFIASHIRIPEAGPVPDDVHFHNVRFQLIFCVAGWVRLVYEGQGDDFVLAAGDCVLQPPRIRHRVLESSAGLEVVEVACPAVHETWFDPELSLPTQERRDEFAGQRFVLHRTSGASWRRWRADGFECRETGIGAASAGVVDARTVRAGAAAQAPPTSHDGELMLWFVLDGEVEVLRHGATPERLSRGDAVGVPAGIEHAIRTVSGCELLEVTVPAS
jgi:quercetin dioxygenase-like cupin family protein